jgi:hypothetical protein
MSEALLTNCIFQTISQNFKTIYSDPVASASEVSGRSGGSRMGWHTMSHEGKQKQHKTI